MSVTSPFAAALADESRIPTYQPSGDDVEYGTEERPFQVVMPGWDDLIHVRPPPDTTTRDYAIFKNSDEATGRRLIGDRVWEHLQKREQTIQAIKASPAPDAIQALRSVIIAIDDAQDVVRAIALGGVALSFVNPAVGLPVVGLAAGANTLLGFAQGLLTPMPAGQRKRRMLGEQRRRPKGRRKLKERGRNFIKGLNVPTALFMGTQSSYTLTGVGTTVGAGIIFAEDTVWGTVRAAQGKQVEMPLERDETLNSLAAKSLINSFWGWLAGSDIHVEHHIQIALATAAAQQILAGEAEGKDLAGRIQEAQDWPLPKSRVTSELSRAQLEANGVDPDGPTGWPVDGTPERLTLNELIVQGNQRYGDTAVELDERLKDDARLHFLTELYREAAEAPLRTVAGDDEPFDLDPEDTESFTLGVMEQLPLQEQLHPAASFRGLCRQHDWWQANRAAFKTRAVGGQKPERGAAVVHQGWRDAFIPEIQAAGGAPKFWLRAGPPTSCPAPESEWEASRIQDDKFGPGTLEIANKGDREIRVRVPPDRERALDRLTSQELYDNLSADPTGESLPVIGQEEASRAPVGDGVYRPYGMFEPVPEEDITPPSRDWQPEISGITEGYVLTDFNFGVYGATHKSGWQEGGPGNAALQNVTWPSRYLPQRDMFAPVGVAGRSTPARVPSAPNEAQARNQYFDTLAEASGVTWSYNVARAETVRMRFVSGWDVFNLLGTTVQKLDQDQTSHFGWSPGYRPQPWLARTRWDDFVDVHLPDGNTPWQGDYVKTMAAAIAIQWSKIEFFNDRLTDEEIIPYLAAFEQARPVVALAWEFWHDNVRTLEDPVPQLPDELRILQRLGIR